MFYLYGNLEKTLSLASSLYILIKLIWRIAVSASRTFHIVERFIWQVQLFFHTLNLSDVTLSYFEFNLCNNCIPQYKGQIRKTQKAENGVVIRVNLDQRFMGKETADHSHEWVKLAQTTSDHNGSLRTVVLLQLLLLMERGMWMYWVGSFFLS